MSVHKIRVAALQPKKKKNTERISPKIFKNIYPNRNYQRGTEKIHQYI